MTRSTLGIEPASSRRVAALLLAIVAAVVPACSEDPPEQPAAAPGDPAPLALVGVLRQDPPVEMPAEDLYLVRLGDALDEGILVAEDTGYHDIRILPADANSLVQQASAVDGFLRLPDDRLLIGLARPATDPDLLDEVGAVVVDPVRRSVDLVFEESGEQSWDAAGTTWDPTARVLRTVAGRCFEWSEATPGAGFSEEPCPEVPSVAEVLTARLPWDVRCCDPLLVVAPRAGGPPVLTLSARPAPTFANPEQLPALLDEEDGALLFSVPVGRDDGLPPDRRLVLLRADGTTADLWTDESAQRFELAATLAEGTVLLHASTDSGRRFDRLMRTDPTSLDTTVLVQDGTIRFAVVPGEPPWLLAWQVLEDDRGASTEVWAGATATGPLRRVAVHDGATLRPTSASVRWSTGEVWYETVERNGPRSNRVRRWRLTTTGPTVTEVEPGAMVLDLGARGLVLRAAPQGCAVALPDARCEERLVLAPDPARPVVELASAPHLDAPWLLPDGQTLVVRARLDVDGVPYEDAVWRIDLDDPSHIDELYGPGGALPAGAVLEAVEGTRPLGTIGPLDLCPGTCSDVRLPQPRDFVLCELDPRAPGC